ALSSTRRSLVNQWIAAGFTPRGDRRRRAGSRHVRGGRHGGRNLVSRQVMPSLESVRSAPAVVLGGGGAGLARPARRARHFARVLVLERDVRGDVAAPEEAFSSWRRGGVPQLRHSHAFLARLRLVLLAHMPDILDRLRASGVREIALA